MTLDIHCSLCAVQESVVSEEIMHNLDTCDVTVVGDELNGDHESLEIDLTQVQQRGLDISSSNVGMIITGEFLDKAFVVCSPHFNSIFFLSI